MGNYYFLAPSLPTLVLDQWPELTFEELLLRCKINLSPEDWEQIEEFRSHIDLMNVRARFLDRPHDYRGRLSEKELDDALLTESYFPEYLFTFLKRFPTKKERIANFSFMLSAFFQDKIESSQGLLRDYFCFEREWRIVLMALRANRAGRDVSSELIYEDPNDPLVARILAQKESSSYDPPSEYADLKETFLSCGSAPWELYKTFAEWRFNRLILLPEGPLFAFGWILMYMAQHIIVENYHRLELEKGEEILRSLVEERVV